MTEIGYNGPMHKEEEGLGYGVFNAPEFKDLQKRVDALEENPTGLPIASANTLGGIKVGDNLSIESDGTLNASGGAVEQVQVDWNEDDETSVSFIKNKPSIPEATPIATTETVGTVKPDGTTITVDNDGTIHSVGGTGESGADWTAEEGEDGYIANKPFDVASGSQREIFNNSLEYQSEASAVDGYSYGGMADMPELSSSDVGKPITVIINGRTMEAVLQYTQENGMEVYYATKDFDMDSEQFLSNLAFLLQIVNGGGVVQNTMFCCIPDEVTAGVDCTVTLSSLSLTKLSGDKIQIDGETIVSDNGVLKAVGGSGSGGADWNADEGEDGFIENKPFDTKEIVQEEYITYCEEFFDISEYGGYNKVTEGHVTIPTIPAIGSSVKVSYNDTVLIGEVRQKELVIEGETYNLIFISNTDDVVFYMTSLFAKEDKQFAIKVGEGSVVFPTQSIIINDSDFDLEEQSMLTVNITVDKIVTAKLNANKLNLSDKFTVNNNALDIAADKVAVYQPLEFYTKTITAANGATLDVELILNRTNLTYSITLDNYTNTAETDAVFESYISSNGWDDDKELDGIGRAGLTIVNDMISGYFRIDADSDTDITITVKSGVRFPGWAREFRFPAMSVYDYWL